jgi:hypothetical protein
METNSLVHCPFVTVRDMTFGILKKFVPSQLSSPSRIGVAFSDRPLEGRYQYEFYRGLFTATGGGVRTGPKLLTAPGACKGRIDFFVPGKKWGIELTREGSNLAEHISRFGLRGKYQVQSIEICKVRLTRRRYLAILLVLLNSAFVDRAWR